MKHKDSEKGDGKSMGRKVLGEACVCKGELTPSQAGPPSPQQNGRTPGQDGEKRVRCGVCVCLCGRGVPSVLRCLHISCLCLTKPTR